MANVDFQIGVDPRNLGAFAPQAPSPTWGTALAKLGGAWAQAHNKKKQAEAKTAAEKSKAKRRSGWIAELEKGTTIPGIAAKDPAIIGDTQFRTWWEGAKPKEQEPGFEDILDDQGRPIAQRGPKGRTFAHPLAPKATGPAATKEDAAGFLRYFGGDQHGKRVYPEVKMASEEPPPPETPFSDKSADERYMNILATGDPSSKRYAAAYNKLGAPRVVFDHASGQQITTTPNMSAFRNPGGQGAIAPQQAQGPGPGPGVGVERVQAVAPKFNEMQARAAQAADELTASISILEAPGEDGKPLFMQGTNPLDSINPFSYGKGADRERYEQSLLGAVQMILRMETGAEAPAHEVKGAMDRYAPRPGDEAATIEQKMEALKRRARSAAEIGGQPYQAVQEQRGAPQPAPQAPQAPPQPQQQQGPSQANLAPMVRALAGALGGAQAAQPPQGPSPADSLERQRVQDYSALKPAVLKRQVDQMAAKLAVNPQAYSQEEIDAAKIAYDRAFPGR